MKAILDFFLGIGSLIFSLVKFVVSTIEDIGYIVGLLLSVMTNMPAYFGWLPSAIITMLLSIISIAVIYKIIGRDG